MQSRRANPDQLYVDTDRNPEQWVFRLTARDQRILQHFWVYGGFLADYQIQALEFGVARRARDRLGKLFHNGYLARTNRHGRAAYGYTLYWLTELGAELAAEALREDIKEYPYLRRIPWGQVGHDVLVNDFTITVQQACTASDEFFLHEWVSERVFRSRPDEVAYTTVAGVPDKRRVIPDQFLVIDRVLAHERFRSRLLVELDNATHPNRRFADQKVLAGLAYLRSEVYERRFGKGGRWLIITTSQTRLGYLKETTEHAAGRDAGVFYFTTFAQVTSDQVLTAPIWIKGGEDTPVALFPPRS